jgi:hypothetical protein
VPSELSGLQTVERSLAEVSKVQCWVVCLVFPTIESREQYQMGRRYRKLWMVPMFPTQADLNLAEVYLVQDWETPM